MTIAIYTLTSELHDEQAVGAVTQEFLNSLDIKYELKGGDLMRCFIEEGELMCNQAKPDLCRTQQVIRLSQPERTSYFLSDPIGNHHIILPGHHQALLEELLKSTSNGIFR